MKKTYKYLSFFLIFAASAVFLILQIKSPLYQLLRIPASDRNGLVLAVKNIKIANVAHPINASICEHENNSYVLVFRFRKSDPDKNYIGLTLLDKNFNQIIPYKELNVNSDYAEDPRIFKNENEYFLVYNDLLPVKHKCRTMHIAKLEKNSWQPSDITSLDLHIKPVEKNWVPFSFEDQIHFAYGLMPHKIMLLENPSVNSLNHYIFRNNDCYSRFYWKWGEPRGGTPAKLIDGEYLAFFHSCMGNRKKWYVMGAYTYQNNPPFKITKVSQEPIIFGSLSKTRVVFPAGFAEGKYQNKDAIIISYGENDNTSKIVILDKAKLFRSLKKVD